MNINDIQPMSLAQMGVFVTETYSYVQASSLAFPTLLGVCAALLATVIIVTNKELAHKLSVSGTAVLNYTKSFWERRAMRKKQREEQEQALFDAVVAHIEACKGLDPQNAKACYNAKRRRGQLPMTRTDANLMYQRLARAYPDFKYAIEKFDTKTKAVEAIANTDRDATGNVIPLPIPDAKKGGETKQTTERKTATFKLRSATP